MLDLLQDAAGRAAGVTLHVLGEGSEDGVGAVRARAVVLATGGMGQVYASTTNPPVSTGDGVALALRAGAAVTDLEFVQFHPTALFLGPAQGQQFLVSEAVRGEGAVLVDADGARVLTAADHPLADLAPRDVVAKAIFRRMRERGEDHVLLDCRRLGEATLLRRFPTIVARCRAGRDRPGHRPPSRWPRPPTTPAAGCAPTWTAARRCPACTPAARSPAPACTAPTGWRPTACSRGWCSPARIAADLARGLPPPGEPVPHDGARPCCSTRRCATSWRRAMTAAPGSCAAPPRWRRAAALEELAARTGAEPLARPRGRRPACSPSPARWSPRPTLREETRGAHWREDHPDADAGLARPPGDHPGRHDASRSCPRDACRDPTRAALADAGLDPAYVEDLARRTVAEDLAGGVDVTSVATVPGRRCTAPPPSCRARPGSSPASPSRWPCSTWSAR